jgi:hypothetical protein
MSRTISRPSILLADEADREQAAVHRRAAFTTTSPSISIRARGA